MVGKLLRAIAGTFQHHYHVITISTTPSHHESFWIVRIAIIMHIVIIILVLISISNLSL